MESSVITPGKVFEASGHVDHFKEPMVECEKCHKRFRADHLLEENGISSADAEKMTLDEVEAAIEKTTSSAQTAAAPSATPQFLNHVQTTIGPYAGASATADPKQHRTYSSNSTASTQLHAKSCHLASSKLATHCETKFPHAKA